jgi:HTH-type transcriptional regulator / antitoxin MqsA
MNTKELCPICGEGHVTSCVDQVESEYKGKKAMLPLHYQVCDVCTSDFAGMEESRLNKRAVMAFRKSVDGVLTGDEIRALRDKYKLTQGQAAKLFGGGPVAFSKYENDDVAHSEAMDTLLRLVRRSEAAFWELAAEKDMSAELAPVKFVEKIVELTTVTATNDNVFDLAHFRGRVFRSSSSSTFSTTSNEMKQWKQ